MNTTSRRARLAGRLCFDRNELAGSFGDIGTDLPLIIRDIAAEHGQLFIALLVALCAAFLPQGYVIGLLLGLVLFHTAKEAMAHAQRR